MQVKYPEIIYMSSRRTIMSGEVVSFATGFDSSDGAFGTIYDAIGPFYVSASRDAVVVHRAECHTADDVRLLIGAINMAEAVRINLLDTWRGGAKSRYPEHPTPCPDTFFPAEAGNP